MSRHCTFHDRLVGGLALAAILTALPAVSEAFTVKGKIVNGTTGATNLSTDVTIVNPSGGMMAENVVKAVDGKFTVENLDKNEMYMFRVDYQGVMYSQQLPPDAAGADPRELTVMVYEPTTSWDQVHVTVPHVVATRHSDHLVIERIYEINNESSPPRTMTGKDGYFRFQLPSDYREINVLRVSSMGVPVDRQPIETGEPGIFMVEYPMRPGVTRVGMSYTVPYASGSYTLTETALYPIDEMTIFDLDPTMTITSPTNQLQRGDGVHGEVSYKTTLAKGATLTLAFSGGTEGGGEMSGASQGGGGEVIVVPDAAENTSLMIMFVVLLALLALFAISLKSAEPPAEERRALKEFKDVFVRRIAKLDDLHQTGAIPAGVYHEKRAELKNQLASLMYRIESLRGSGSQQKNPRHGQRQGKRSNVR